MIIKISNCYSKNKWLDKKNFFFLSLCLKSIFVYFMKPGSSEGYRTWQADLQWG